MDFARAASLCVLISWAGVMWPPPEASAQSWDGSRPIFQSDIERQQRELEAQRAERRKSYDVVYPKFMDGGERPHIEPQEPPIVYLEKKEKPGTIIVDTGGRMLYYVLPGQRAYAYPISVGREGFNWTGTERISRIASWPSWTPPPEMRQRQPGLPLVVTGGINNPLGAKALYLGNTLYRIHGTNNPRSIGRASSSGCFRMMNEHVVHLASLAKVGTVVRVVSSYPWVSNTMPLSMLFSNLGIIGD
jgi:lipoprotein-anchoring transpeptidase ErfK/SrfK|nr:MAG: L,D-transpeptidase [Pseudomonadota bacterium]